MIDKGTAHESDESVQLKRSKKNLKNPGLTGNRILTLALIGLNALSCELIKPTGEQAIMSSYYTQWWKWHEQHLKESTA